MKAESVFSDVSASVAAWVSDRGGERGETETTCENKTNMKKQERSERDEGEILVKRGRWAAVPV